MCPTPRKMKPTCKMRGKSGLGIGSAWWDMAVKDGETLSGRKEKHTGAHLKPSGKMMKVKACANKAGVGFMNRRELEDKVKTVKFSL